MRKLVLITALAAAASATAWLWFGRGTSGALDADHPLHFVPADTPIVLATVEPMPEAVVQRWMDYANAQLDSSRMQIEHAMRDLEAAMPSPADPSDLADAADASDAGDAGDVETEAAALQAFEPSPIDHKVLNWMKAAQIELKEASDVRALHQRFGLSTHAMYALYTIDSIPVIRLQLDDPAAFIAGIERLQKNSGETLPTLQLDGIQAGWDFHFEDAPFSLLAAVIDTHLVFIPAPKTLDRGSATHRYDPAILRPLLGLERPSRSLAQSGQLQAMIREQGYHAHAGGYIETAHLFQQLRQPGTPQQAFLSALDIQKPELTPGCDADIARFSRLFPRLTFGSTELEAGQINFIARLSTAPVIANALMQLRAPMPGRKAEDTSLVMYGMAAKLQPLPGLGSRLANIALEQPWTCPELSWINDLSEQGRKLNNATVYAIAPVLQSYVLALEDLSIDFDAAKLRTLDAQVILGSENPQSLIGSAQMLDPDLKDFAAQLKPGAPAQPMPKSDGLLSTLGIEQPLMVAVHDKALGLAIGTQAKERLDTQLSSDQQPGPLLYISYSGKVYSRLVEILREYAARQPEPDMAIESMIQSLDNGYDKIIDRFFTRLDITEKGIEFEYRIKFK